MSDPTRSPMANTPDGWVLQVRALPPLPEALRSAMLALRQSQLSDRRCIALIECDPGLAARVLRLANSSFYGLPGRVGSIADAVHLLGLRCVAGVLAAVTLREAIPVDACPAFDFNHHWHHAVATGTAARLLAPHAGVDPDMAMVTGLLHDTGRLVMAALQPALADQVFRQQAPDHDKGDEAAAEAIERAAFGLPHGPLGAVLLRHWQLPDEVANAVAEHHAPAQDAGASFPLARLLRAANGLAHLAEAGPPRTVADAAQQPASDALTPWQAHGRALGIADCELPTWVARVSQEAKALRELLALPG